MNASATPSSSSSPHYLHWFRRDLRTHDNTALAHAVNQATQHNGKVSAVFVVTPKQWAEHDMSAVQLDFIFRTLAILQQELAEQFNIQLYVLEGTVLKGTGFDEGNDALIEFCEREKVTHLVANMEYEVNELERDRNLGKRLEALKATGVLMTTFHDQCVLPPKSVTTGDGNMYQVFTPFYKKWQAQLDASSPQLLDLHELHDLNMPSQSKNRDRNTAKNWLQTAQTELKQLHKDVIANYLHHNDQHHAKGLAHCQKHYPAGETEAKHRLDQFIADDIKQYDIARDRPALHATSQLSAYLTLSSISPRYCYLQAKKALDKSLDLKQDYSVDIQRWISELAWRDFYRHVIANRADIVKGNAYKVDTDTKVNWSYNEDEFGKWCEGKTGVPLVDSAMRCLNATGFMHNRLRMVTAMFLTKDLLIDWRWGERYFMQHLIDGDFASNNGGWQWSASVGTDSAPYFRIINPFSQGKTHDKEAVFIKQWLPELKDVPATVLHDEAKLRKALCKGGEFAQIDYPLPMVEHKQARQLAIAEFKGG